MAISFALADGVATVTLDRPEKLNALDAAHLRELRRLLASASAHPDVRAVVLTGAGDRAFCAGADLTAAPAAQTGVAEAFGYDLDRAAEHGLYIRLMDLSGLRLRKPLIAAVNGFCLGGGLELALQCDLIVASEQASFGLPEVAVASLPGAGGVPNLLRAVPRAVAMRMLLTGERISAQRAYDIGLVSDLFASGALAEGAAALARRIAGNGPLAVQLVKMLGDQASDLGHAQSMQLTELAWGLLRDTEDRVEGRRAFAERRPPNYIGR